MTDPADAPDPTPPENITEQLRSSYGAMIRAETWEVDVDESSTGIEQSTPASPPAVERIVEALLFVGGAPLTPERAGETIRGLTQTQFTHTVDCLNRDYRRQNRPYTIRPVDSGYVLELRPRFLPLRERLYGGLREARLSPAAIDVLALVAYRQPATKQEVDGLRGSDSGGILRQLVRRGLIAVVQRGDGRQHDVSYGTTQRFLETFGLSSLDDLPQTQDLQTL